MMYVSPFTTRVSLPSHQSAAGLGEKRVDPAPAAHAFGQGALRIEFEFQLAR